MKKLILILGCIMSATCFADSIVNTKHNLSTSGTGVNTAGGTDGVCSFCHTPHGSDTTAAVPLWNKKLPGTNYAIYNSQAGSATSSIDGQILAVGSVSLGCLSCHDGTQAMDNVINAPGSGGYNAGGASMPGANWTGANQVGGILKAGIITNIGGDLTNDHPIGIQYCGGGLTGAGSVLSGACNDADFKMSSSDVKTATINGKQIFWVETNGISGRQKEDIPLYTRDFTGAPGTPSVECASCHSVHQEAKSVNEVAFMRVTTAGSQICLSCHIK